MHIPFILGFAIGLVERALLRDPGFGLRPLAAADRAVSPPADFPLPGLLLLLLPDFALPGWEGADVF